ncbi:MAG: hypothetical protein H6721_02080 [Sandaracinus sp.]|nr:hypothetical protein [Sandaracinus sp.]MCB9630931.1 hypothetical protein [Sandaracinus sp.]
MKPALLALAFALLFPALALACSCMRSSPTEAAARSTAVFEGRVVELTPIQREGEVTLEGGCLDPACNESLSETTHQAAFSSFAVRFEVTRQWKGVESESVVVHTARDSAACGFPFEVGQDYLVYASAEQDGTLSTGLCDRTALVADASEDLAALQGPGEVPVDVHQDEPADQEPSNEPPARGGCASCATGGASTAGLFPMVLGVLFALRRRR